MDKRTKKCIVALFLILGSTLFTKCTALGILAGTQIGELEYSEKIKYKSELLELDRDSELKVVLTNKDTLYGKFQSYEEISEDSQKFNYQLIIIGVDQWYSAQGNDIKGIYVGELESSFINIIIGGLIGLGIDILFFSQFEIMKWGSNSGGEMHDPGRW